MYHTCVKLDIRLPYNPILLFYNVIVFYKFLSISVYLFFIFSLRNIANMWKSKTRVRRLYPRVEAIEPQDK